MASRPFRATDRDACLAVFDSNVPDFLSAGERDEFAADLELAASGANPFLVLTRAGSVVACGGLWLGPDRAQAALSWGMVSRPFHRQGLGTRLVRDRLAMARALPGLQRLTLATSQHTRAFYEGFGFALVGITPDGFGPGLDRCDMILRLWRRLPWQLDVALSPMRGNIIR